jgi:hypothetical protein
MIEEPRYRLVLDYPGSVWRFNFEPTSHVTLTQTSMTVRWCREEFGYPWTDIFGENSKWCRADKSFRFACESLAVAFRMRWT